MTCFAEHLQSVRGVVKVCLPKCFVCHESADQDFNAALCHARPPSGLTNAAALPTRNLCGENFEGNEQQRVSWKKALLGLTWAV